MKTYIMKKAFNTIAFMLFTIVLVSCNPNNKNEKIESSTVSSVNVIIPDSVVQFLIILKFFLNLKNFAQFQIYLHHKFFVQFHLNL